MSWVRKSFRWRRRRRELKVWFHLQGSWLRFQLRLVKTRRLLIYPSSYGYIPSCDQDNSCLLLKLSAASILFGNQRVFRDEISDDQLGYRILVVPYSALCKYFNTLCSHIVDKKTKCSRSLNGCSNQLSYWELRAVDSSFCKIFFFPTFTEFVVYHKVTSSVKISLLAN